ncbi:RNA polymerase sigma factor [Thermoflexibacter ruber]|uniref:RNA polymerase sigma-70 factor, ECF subfamily n=1 Tax=Thermoflexibacter ruber TaxID=1003 RepID=A0A1I2AG87_9BACT|nr:RNA polymerase sigma factor [Thermoflexibacter ruber]SFE42578.1 RNA polymerase sigma-70 factor, ECF subfamily [Thermoflexibacter ruber]
MNFDHIYSTYWQKIFRLCMGYVNDFDLAKDLTQDTFVIVWQQLPHFRNESAIGTWIFRIASNNCLRQIEKQNRTQKVKLPTHLQEDNSESMESHIQFLYQCISELPEIERIIISLELEDVKQAEIAQIVGLSEGNVRVKIHRIKEKLAQKLKEIWTTI